MHSVLFVCTANICRSPMAMGLLRKLTETDQSNWSIDSAGVWAVPGLLASEFAQLALAEKGIDISDHRSKAVTSDLLDNFKLILVMEHRHKEVLWSVFPDHRSRILMLTELHDKVADIADPIGMRLIDYRTTANEIDEILNLNLKKIKHLSRGKVDQDG
jgi:protein-tyrosine-phosphatase